MKKSIKISGPIIWSEVLKEIKQFPFSKFEKSLKDHFLSIYRPGIGWVTLLTDVTENWIMKTEKKIFFFILFLLLFLWIIW